MENKEQGKLGLIACIAILTGGCIGSAIFSLSGMTMINGGPASILTWIIAAVILAMYGMLVAELAVRYPKSGGVFVFPAKALNRGAGFFSAWGYVISNIIAVAFSAITVGTFICAGLSPMTQGAIWAHSGTITLVAALVAVLIVTILNMMDITASGKINDILVALLVVAMLIYTVFAFASPNFSWANYANFFTGAQGTSGWIRAIPNAMVAYGSCVAIAFMVGQVKDPNKNVPKSLAISMVLVVALYLCMVVSSLGVVTYETLAAEDGAFQPMFIAINHMGYEFGTIVFLYILIGVAGLLALITTLLVVQGLNARALQSMADDGLVPACFTKTNKHGMPSIATLVLAILAGILCCFNDVTNLLVNLGSITGAATMIIVMLAYIAAQKKTQLEAGQYRAPGGVVLAIVAMIVIFITYIPSIFAADAMTMWIFTACIYAAGAIVFFIFRNKKA